MFFVPFGFKSKFSIKHYNKPFFIIPNEEYTVKIFVDAVMNDSFDVAESCISQKSVYNVDFNELKKLFNGIFCFKYSFNNVKHKIDNKVNSFIIQGNDGINVIKIYVVNEPDFFSKWKIYKIEREHIINDKAFGRCMSEIKRSFT